MDKESKFIKKKTVNIFLSEINIYIDYVPLHVVIKEEQKIQNQLTNLNQRDR